MERKLKKVEGSIQQHEVLFIMDWDVLTDGETEWDPQTSFISFPYTVDENNIRNFKITHEALADLVDLVNKLTASKCCDKLIK